MAVGLPEGQMGNSEVGHLNMGAGRVVVNSTSKLSSRLTESLSFGASFQVNHDSEPAAGKVPTDTILGLTVEVLPGPSAIVTALVCAFFTSFTGASGVTIVAAARGWIGTPYRHQGSRKGVGCDCLGLARGVWREVVGPEPFPIPPYSRDWGETGPREVLADGARWKQTEGRDTFAKAGQKIEFFEGI